MKNFKAALAKTREVALYAQTGEYPWYTVFETAYSKHDECGNALPEGQRRELPLQGYVRISEPLRIELKGLADEVVVRNAVESLNAEERQILREMNKKLDDIRDRKNQLLALTHGSAS